MSRRAAVMQPTYLPWLGYFDLIDQSDVFVFLDTVQFTKQSWQQRNRVKTPQGAAWLTVPVHQSLGQKITDVGIREPEKFRHKHWSSIVANYGRTPFWAAVSPRFKALYEQPIDKLCELNIAIIQAIADELKLTTLFVRTSELPPIEGHKADMLVNLCRYLEVDVYLSPMGARDYLTDDAAFTAAQQRLEFHVYQHPTYPQLFGEFVPYMCALDALFNAGPEETARLMRSGRRPSLSVTQLPPLTESA
jgi:hypothetical protein